MTAPRRKPTRAKALGVSDDDYARLLAAQDGHCALCPATPKTRRLHVDHDHMSKPPRVRGLLCHRCNRALPTWMTRAWLEAAADYIDPSPAPRTLSRVRRQVRETLTFDGDSILFRQEAL